MHLSRLTARVRRWTLSFTLPAVTLGVAATALAACYGDRGDESTNGTRTPTSAYVPVEASAQNPTPPGAGPPAPGPEEPDEPTPDASPPGDTGSPPPADSSTGD